ncbi:MAG: lipid-A-disaccharide synthase [Candidatus Syntrophosphaera sp.]|nr:lipid-A-disaccharide synthase [Candidatus Syntrophosphaera sp.]
MAEKSHRIFWLVGENSGDLHASLVMKSINAAIPGVSHIGIGGSRMQAEGLKPLFPFARFNVMGFSEVLAHLPFFLKVEKRLQRFFKQEKPDLAILVDYPGLNLRIANLADNLRIPVLYYICPQFWAWKHERVHKLRASVRQVACILPFEQELLEIHNVSATYVGHPIAEEISFELDRGRFAQFYGLDEHKQWLGFLPGSRDVEIRRMLPIFLQAAKRFDPGRFEFLVSKALTVSHTLFMDLLESSGLKNIRVIDGYRYEMMKYSDLLVSTSGTATLEAAYIGTPLLICYKASPLSYLIGRQLIHVKRIGLPNIVLDKDLLPELIQNELTPTNIKTRALELLDDPDKMASLKQELSHLQALLSDRQTSVEMLRLVKELLGLDE